MRTQKRRTDAVEVEAPSEKRATSEPRYEDPELESIYQDFHAAVVDAANVKKQLES